MVTDPIFLSAFTGLIAGMPAMQVQDVIAVPAIPVGVSPIMSWVMTVAGGVIAVFVPIVALWLRTYLSVQNTQARAGMINGSIVRAAHLADLDMTQQNLNIGEVGPNSPTMKKAVEYVEAAHPDAISATPEATDKHLVDAITATLHQIQLAKSETTVPSVVLSPVSAIR